VAANALTVNRPSVIFDEQGGEVVIIDLERGHYFRLDAAGTRIWLALAATVDPDALLAACENRDELAGRLDDILTELRDLDLIRPAADAEPAQPVAAWRFDGYTLERFTDLEDILGLDPIHEADQGRGWPHTSA
jgi:hypothetical protein